MALFNFKKNEKQGENNDLKNQYAPQKIPEIIVSTDEKNELSAVLSNKSIEHYYTNAGYEKYKLHFEINNFEAVRDVLDDFYGALIESEYDQEEEREDYYEELETGISAGKIKNNIELDLQKVEPIKPKIMRKKLGRNTELKARFTDEEVEIINEKIKKSGLRKGEFIRKCLLEIEIKEINPQKIGSNTDALLELKSEIGKVGGLLKAFIKPNLENHNVSYEDMQQIKKILNELENLKKKVDKEVKKRWQ